MTNIDMSRIQTSEARTLARLASARAEAIAVVAKAVEARAQDFGAGASVAEQLMWAGKESAAQAILAGAASADQIETLEGECAETGETLNALAEKIVARAKDYRVFAARLTGLRRKGGRQIAEAQTPEAIADCVKGLRAAISALK